MSDEKIAEITTTIVKEAINKNFDSETQKQIGLVTYVVGMRELVSHFRNKKMFSASNWILAGAIAFIYSILLDPQKLIQNYGSWQVKCALVLFSLSLFYGIKNLIQAGVIAAFNESEHLKQIIDIGFEHWEKINNEKQDKKEDIKNSETQVAGESIAKHLVDNLKGTKDFWLQLFTFSLATSIFLIMFFLKD